MRYLTVENKRYIKVIDVTGYSVADIEYTYNFYTDRGFRVNMGYA